MLDIDGRRYDKRWIADFFRKNRYDIVGISAMATLYNYVIWFSGLIKEIYPETLIVLGGSLASSAPGLVLKNAKVDICVIGEGEETAVDVAECLLNKEDFHKVDGIAFRENGEISYTKPRTLIRDLDSIADIDFDAIRLKDYLYPGSIVTARGCTDRCTFCFESFKQKVFRRRSNEYILREMEMMKNRYGIEFFSFLDSHIMTNTGNLTALCEGIKKLGAEWDCNGRLDRVNAGLVSVMKGAGCRRIFYGVESFNQSILDEMNKNVTVEEISRGLSETFKGGMKEVATSFIIGSFSETEETIDKNIEMAKSWNTINACFYMTPFPGTPLYGEALKKGLITDEKGYFEDYLGRGDEFSSISNIFYINLTSMTDEQVIAGYKRMRKELKMEPAPINRIKDYLKTGFLKAGLLKAR